ncbi:MAG: VanZ family protein [Candidatus Doudnabacteria bacterium]|nr:VanZ family protein [Candidatus Doudnabacteria bacterium]
MKKFLITFSIVVAAVFFSYSGLAQAKDLCGGTGGNGEIISLENNGFTLKLNGGGNKKQNEGDDLIVSLANGATIETQAGVMPLSALKIGDRVTLVGDSHRNGTFTAQAVVLCDKTGETGTKVNEAGGVLPVTVRNQEGNYNIVSRIINITTIIIVGLIWLAAVAFILLKKRKGLVYALFFTIFYIYLYKVIDYTLLQFQSLLLLQHFVPGLMLRGVEAGRNLNLLPLVTLTPEDIKTSALNILMMVPFGFGLPFITNYRMKKVVMAGLFLSIVIEFLQFVTGFMANATFRVADINDLIFNTLGVAIGYLLFKIFIRIYCRIYNNWKTKSSSPPGNSNRTTGIASILQYIADRSK